MTEARISRRAAELVENSVVPEYIVEHFERRDTWWTAENPDGYIGLCIAENKLGFELLESKMAASRRVPPTALGYDQMTGSAPFRQALADFLGRTLMGRSLDPGNIAVLAGAGTVLETLFYALADPGEGVLVPTPSYAGFWIDLVTRNHLTIVPVDTSSNDGFTLTTALLDDALRTAEVPVRALLFTSPNNPLGTVYSRAEITELMAWGRRNDVHIVFDEIFAHSVFGADEFVSTGAVESALGPNNHIVWAFSKDFGMSGLRAGVLISENPAVLEAVGQIAVFAATSGDTQHLLTTMIADDDWVDAYLAANTVILRTAYERTTAALDAASIPYLDAQAGLFVYCDFRRYLSEPGWSGEAALWRRFLDEAQVNLTPGADCHAAEPGFMRLVFASMPTEAVESGIRRLADLQPAV